MSSQITTSGNSGCAPLSVLFSGPAGATNILWNLGTGIGTSTLATPNPVYNSAGTYNVTYTAIVNGSPVNYNVQITVYPGPSGSFSYILPAARCAPMTVTFNATGGTSGSSYNYSFGDLTSSVGAGNSVVHTYNFVGNYVPGVTIVDASTGCTGSATPVSNVSVVVSSSPNVVISSSQGYMGCNPPFNTNLTGSLSSGSSNALPLSFSWVIGGGSPASSGLATPGPVSFSNGQHAVILTVTDNNGCSNSASVGVNVVTPSLAVTAQPSVCANTGLVINVNASHSPVDWASSTGPSPITNSVVTPGLSSTMMVGAYTSGGLKTYTISINPGGICPPVVRTGSVFVEEVIAAYTPTLPTPIFCSSPSTFSLTNISTVNNGSALTFIWSAQSGTSGRTFNAIAPTTATTTNVNASPTFTISQGSNYPYTCFNHFQPGIVLTAISNSSLQCSSSSVIRWGLFSIWKPTPMFFKSKSQGCAPLTVNFQDSTTFCRPGVAVTGYTFYYGNGQSTTGTSGGFNFNYTYTTAGVYNASLTVQVGSCTATSYVDPITVTAPPVISANIISPSPCAGYQSVTINMTATSGTINHWHANTDLGYYWGCIDDPSPSYPFYHTGTHTVSVFGYQNGCASNTLTLPTINVKGPFGQTRHETTCVGNKKTVTFYTHLHDVQSSVLNFGDGNSVNLAGAPGSRASYTNTHTYLSTGNYTASLVSTGPSANGCNPHTFTLGVKVREPNANILFNGLPLPNLPQALACETDTYNFTASTSIDVNATCRTGYVWNMITPTYTMPTWENSNPALVYCGATQATLHMPPPPPPGRPPYHTIHDTISRDRFLSPGIYTISLSVRDENGCMDTETKQFRISSAKPDFTFNANPVCLSAGSIQVINNTPNIQIPPDVINGYTINFGDGFSSITSTLAAFNPTYSYAYAFPPFQVYNITMTAQNTLGCIGSTTKTLQVNNPVPGLQPINPAHYFPCIKKSLTTTVNFTANPGYLTYTVNFGDPPTGSPSQTMSAFSNVPHIYTAPGIYVASLSVIDNGACRATEVKTITVIGQPTASIQFSNNLNRFCVNDVLNASSNTSLFVTPMTNTLWTFTGLQSNTNIVSQNLPTTGAFQIVLSVNWNGYCQSSDTQMVYVSDPKAKLELDKNIFCLGDIIKVRIKDTTSIGEWQWAFGDNVPQVPVVVGTFTSNLVPSPFPYTYNIYPNNGQEGKTLLTLFYYGAGKTCKRQDTTSLFVIKIDSDFEQTKKVYLHCLGLPDEFKANISNPYNINLNYNWNFSGASSNLQQPTHTFTQTGVVPVSLTITNPDYGCKSTSVKNMTILPLPKASLRVYDTICPLDTFAIIGSGFPGIPGINSQVNGILSFNSQQDSIKFTAQNTFSITKTASLSTNYSLTVMDANGCVSLPVYDSIFVQQKPKPIQWDTTVIIGELIPINAFVGKNYTYSWTPVFQNLSCQNCYNPVSNTTVNLTYTMVSEDTPLACFATSHTFSITINPKTSIDVPTAFTPNGDGINDVIYVGGWGIKKLLYFKIFNRWGQLLFQTNDLKSGWDGKFEGVPQNMETYVYEAAVETYLDNTLTKSGTIKILR